MRERIARAWEEACWALGIRARSDTLSDLLTRYAEPHRHYHDLSHIDACLRLFEEHRGLAERSGEVIAALLFHDAVYDPTRDDNEARSAELARSALSGAPQDAIERIAAAIAATRTHVTDESPDIALVLDVDLSILGADPETYDFFERAIRAEYRHVPEELYRVGRRAVLERFEERECIYRAPRLRDAFETSARANLRRAIAALSVVRRDGDQR